MKINILIFCFYSLLGFSQTKESGCGEVLKNMNLQQNAWNQGDVKGFMNYYWANDSLKFIGNRGITYGWQRTLDNYLKAYPDKAAMGTLKFTILETSQLSPTAVHVIGKWELEKEKPVGGYFTLLWKRLNGIWVIVCDHTS